MIFTKCFVHVAYHHGSVLLWWGDAIPRGRGNFWVFLIDNALGHIARTLTEKQISLDAWT